MSNCMTVRDWNPQEILKLSDKSVSFALILLNQPVINQEYFVTLWNQASVRMIVDGGGNQWDLIRQNFPSLAYPHIVSGDFDSIQPKLLDLFKQKDGVDVEETPDQDETDFMKAIRILQNKMSINAVTQVSKIVAYCETAGRFDQIIANIETLFHATIIIPGCQLHLLSSTTMTWLLNPGSHRILCGDLAVPYCSLIPIGSPSVVTSTGLKWNLTNDKLAFGLLVSTSNEISKENVEQIVTVKTSEPILWSMEMEVK